MGHIEGRSPEFESKGTPITMLGSALDGRKDGREKRMLDQLSFLEELSGMIHALKKHLLRIFHETDFLLCGLS